MKILLFTHCFNPDSLTSELFLARCLGEMGHEVTVLIAGSEVFTQPRSVRSMFRPFKREQVGNVRVMRFPLDVTHADSAVRLGMRFITFGVSGVLGSLLIPRPDVAYVAGGPPVIALPALALEKFRGVPFVYSIQDLRCDPSAIRKMARLRDSPTFDFFRESVNRAAVQVVVASNEVEALIEARGVIADKIAVIPKWTADDQVVGESTPRVRSTKIYVKRVASILEDASAAGRGVDPIVRGIDVLASSSALVLLSGPMVALWFLVRAKLGKPALFRQTRPGRYGQPFTMYKFRTMTDARGEDGGLLPDAERLTNFGRALRSTSLDELPELFNVLKGEMAIVGPRPLLMRYTAFFSEVERLRLAVRPGITGWAQVNGRNTASWSARLALDVWYVQHRSLALNTKIVVRTVAKVLQRDGLLVDPGSVMKDLDDERRSHGHSCEN